MMSERYHGFLPFPIFCLSGIWSAKSEEGNFFQKEFFSHELPYFVSFTAEDDGHQGRRKSAQIKKEPGKKPVELMDLCHDQTAGMSEGNPGGEGGRGDIVSSAFEDYARNFVSLVGDLSVPARVRELSSGVSLAVIVLRVPGPDNRCTSVPITVRSPTPPLLRLPKGTALTVEGKLVRRFWTRRDGVLENRLEVIAETLLPLS